MKKFNKRYRIREKDVFRVGTAFSIPLTFSNHINHIEELNYIYVPYAAPTRGMFTPEISRNRKYQIKQ